jgi:hypothetical protein
MRDKAAPAHLRAQYAGGPRPESADSLDLGASGLGQNCSGCCPQHCPNADGDGFAEELGEPISIQAVARLIGCSVWTVRQRYLPAGLPHLRARAQGKLLFYRTQIIRWLLDRQRKGGTIT